MESAIFFRKDDRWSIRASYWPKDEKRKTSYFALHLEEGGKYDSGELVAYINESEIEAFVTKLTQAIDESKKVPKK